eukprot:UN31188
MCEQLCYSPVKSVRQKASTAFNADMIVRRCVPSIVSITMKAFKEFLVERTDEERHMVLGSLSVLNVRTLGRVLGSDIDRNILFIQTLMGGSIHKHSEITDAMFMQFVQ